MFLLFRVGAGLDGETSDVLQERVAARHQALRRRLCEKVEGLVVCDQNVTNARYFFTISILRCVGPFFCPADQRSDFCARRLHSALLASVVIWGLKSCRIRSSISPLVPLTYRGSVCEDTDSFVFDGDLPVNRFFH
jgi:hypothetical protein